MNSYDTVQLVLLAMDGQVEGKTKLQKMVYFVGVMTGSLDELGYRPHFYGPYSPEVAGGLNRLQAMGFLDYTKVSSGFRDESGFEQARHDYHLNDDGIAAAKRRAGQHSEEWKGIKEAVNALRSHEQNYVELSIAAKAFCLLDEKSPATIAELEEIAPRFGWSVTPQELRNALGFLKSLSLVSESTRSPPT